MVEVSEVEVEEDDRYFCAWDFEALIHHSSSQIRMFNAGP